MHKAFDELHHYIPVKIILLFEMGIAHGRIAFFCCRRSSEVSPLHHHKSHPRTKRQPVPDLLGETETECPDMSRGTTSPCYKSTKRKEYCETHNLKAGNELVLLKVYISLKKKSLCEHV